MTMQRWNIDTSHSGIEFSVRHLMISKVRGAFETWRGTIDFDSNEPEASKVSVQIEAGSIDTREPSRDAHLRSADFFDVEKYPSLTFESRKVERAGDNRYRVIGDLTLHGVTRSVVLDAEYLGTGMDAWGKERIGFFAKTAINRKDWGKERIGFFAKTAINRKDFGLNWNQVLEAGGVVVSDQVDITLDVQAVNAQAIGQAA